MSWRVHKFGGTSLGDSSCIVRCAELIQGQLDGSRLCIVVSAMGGKPKITDLLLDAVKTAASNNSTRVECIMQEIRSRHVLCIQNLLSEDTAKRLIDDLDCDLNDIRDLLRAVRLMRTAQEQMLELVSGYGEIWSARVFSSYLLGLGVSCSFLNARDVLIVNERAEVGTEVDWERSHYLLSGKDFLDKHIVVTGYIASTADGVATTLKRDGSDFTASIFGRLLQAQSITIWTDVDGVYSADPHRVSDATVIDNISYSEAIELAYFGAKVIHPKTMTPAIASKIPIFIRNSFNSSNPGTCISFSDFKPLDSCDRSICGFSVVDGLSLLNLEGSGVIGVTGIAQRLFGSLRAALIPVLFVAQASSEHNICFATQTIYAEKAVNVIDETFFYERTHQLVSKIRVVPECAIIVAVGESMNKRPGVAGHFFSALGDANINVISFAQGCDERSISAVVQSRDATKALRAVHSAFSLSPLPISVVVIGTGRVGCALLRAFVLQKKFFEQRLGLRILIRGIADSSRMLLGEDLLDNSSNERNRCALSILSNSWQSDEQSMEANLSILLDHLRASVTPHSIIVDTSTSDQTAELHPLWLQAGCHIVAANKRAISSSLELFNSVVMAARLSRRMYLSEVTIGASLPVVTTLHDILCSGDIVHSIVGIMSVSVNTVLTDICEGSLSFTQAVQRTHSFGLFEEDVFSDLEGTEVAAKLLILMRALGFPSKLEDISIEPLAKRRAIRDWNSLSDEFRTEDQIWKERAKLAKERQHTVRYVQRIEIISDTNKTPKIHATVKLDEVPMDSPHARVKGPVYFFSFHTDRYSQNPLVIQGPLSDSANTASGLLGDILRIARSLGIKDKGPDIALA